MLAVAGLCSVGYNSHGNIGYGVNQARNHADGSRNARSDALNEIQKLLMVKAYRIACAAESYIGAVVADHRAQIFSGVALNADEVFDFVSETQG